VIRNRIINIIVRFTIRLMPAFIWGVWK